MRKPSAKILAHSAKLIRQAKSLARRQPTLGANLQANKTVQALKEIHRSLYQAQFDFDNWGVDTYIAAVTYLNQQAKV